MNNLIKKMNFSCLWLAFLPAFIGVFSSCSDDVIEYKDDENKLFTLSTQELSVSSKAQYHSLQIIPIVSGLDISIESDSEWIRVPEDTVASDGWFDIYIDEDKEQFERSAQLTITASNGMNSQTEICHIKQSEDTGTNDYEEPASKTMRVGYGYDIFGKYMNDLDVKKPILSQNLLLQYTDDSGLVETNSRSVLDIEKNTSRGLVEMAKMLTKKQEKIVSGLNGSTRTVNEISSSSYDGTTNQYAYIRFYKTTAMRSIDIGMLKMMLDNGKQVFSDDFSDIRAKIIKDPTRENITQMLQHFGTHLVVQGELGAAIEVTARFDEYLTGELDLRVDDFANYFFKGEKSSFVLSTGQIKDMESNIEIGVNCHIYGGSVDTKKALEEDIIKNGRVKEDILLDWLNSSSGNASDSEIAKALVPIRFQLIPIWELFPKECLNSILNVVTEVSERSTNKVADNVAGTDYYKIKLSEDLLAFKDEADKTLVRVLYASNTNSGPLSPVLEICNEYVPVIRGDKRITVVYGIKNGRPFHGAGLFPGDGEGNPPAWLTFSEGDVYVKPIKGAGAFEKIKDVYYLHGNIYETNLGVDTPIPAKMRTVDESLTLQYDDEKETYPIVKIGSGYWTRKNINVTMAFEYNYNSCDWKDPITNDNYYACAFGTNNDVFMWYNDKVYGFDMDEDYKVPTKWHVPQTAVAYTLSKYLGHNLKGLMKNQVVGFDAQFWGYYGNIDYLGNNKKYPNFEVRDTEKCYITFKNDERSCMALVLTQDYKFLSIPEIRSETNMYPIRLFRTSFYRYTNLN